VKSGKRVGVWGWRKKKVERFIRGSKLTLVQIFVSHLYNAALRDKHWRNIILFHFATKPLAEQSLQLQRKLRSYIFVRETKVCANVVTCNVIIALWQPLIFSVRGTEPFIKCYQSLSWSRNLLLFMEPNVSLQFSLKSKTGLILCNMSLFYTVSQCFF